MLSRAAVQLCRQCRQQFVSLPLRCPPAIVQRPSQADVELHSWLMKVPVRCAGHAHWQNVRKIKAAKDDQKHRTINAIVNRIRIAVRGSCCVCLTIMSIM